MDALSVDTVVSRVRKNLDEIDPNGSIMYYPSGSESKDNTSLDDIIERSLPEAINAVHLAAPATVLVGKPCEDIVIEDVDEDGVLSFSLDDTDDITPLRVVWFKAADSHVVVTDAVDEASPEGRKQLNKYICGRFDRPRLVRLQDSKTHFRYYSVTETLIDAFGGGDSDPDTYIGGVNYIPESFYEDSEYLIDSYRLIQNAIDQVTAMVLETYGAMEKAAIFYQRATIFH